MSEPTRLNRLFIGQPGETPSSSDSAVLDCGKGYMVVPSMADADFGKEKDKAKPGALFWNTDQNGLAFLDKDKNVQGIGGGGMPKLSGRSIADARALWDAVKDDPTKKADIIGRLFFDTDKSYIGVFTDAGPKWAPTG